MNARSHHVRSLCVVSAVLLSVPLSFESRTALAANRLRASGATLELGQTGVTIPVTGDNDVPVTGFSVALDYDVDVLDVTAVERGAASLSADFFHGSFAGGRVVYGVVLDLDDAGATIPPGTDRELVRLIVDVVATGATATQVSFRDERHSAGSLDPDEVNVLVDEDGFSVPGLTTTDAAVTIIDPQGGGGLDAPSCLFSTSVSSSSIRITWADNTSEEERYEVERRPLGSQIWTPLGSVPANVTEYLDNDVTLGEAFEYRVRAVGDGTSSGFSSSIVESAKSLSLEKAKGKLGKKGWKLNLNGMTLDLGADVYEGDGSEVRVRLGDLEFFGGEVKSKVKADKKTGATSKIQLKDAFKNSVKIDLAKKRLQVKLTVEDPDAIVSGIVPLIVKLGRFDAEIDLPVSVEGPKLNKAIFDPVGGGAFLPLPELNPCNR